MSGWNGPGTAFRAGLVNYCIQLPRGGPVLVTVIRSVVLRVLLYKVIKKDMTPVTCVTILKNWELFPENSSKVSSFASSQVKLL